MIHVRVDIGLRRRPQTPAGTSVPWADPCTSTGGLAEPDGSGMLRLEERPLILTKVGMGPSGPLAVVLRRSGDLSEELKNPIPSRTRPLNSSAPMVLCLKTRESRSLPGLPRTIRLFTFSTHLAALHRRRVCLCQPVACQCALLPSWPATKA
jgi:hypothetical protein